MRNQKGFTIIELLIGIATILIVVVTIGSTLLTLCMGNCWYSEEGVTQALADQLQHQDRDLVSINAIGAFERHIWDYSRVTVTVRNDINSGEVWFNAPPSQSYEAVFYIDSSLLGQYHFIEAPEVHFGLAG